MKIGEFRGFKVLKVSKLYKNVELHKRCKITLKDVKLCKIEKIVKQQENKDVEARVT